MYVYIYVFAFYIHVAVCICMEAEVIIGVHVCVICMQTMCGILRRIFIVVPHVVYYALCAYVGTYACLRKRTQAISQAHRTTTNAHQYNVLHRTTTNAHQYNVLHPYRTLVYVAPIVYESTC